MPGTQNKKASPALQRLAAQSRSALLSDGEYSRAVSGGNLEAATAKAISIVMDLVQQQFPRSCYGTAYPVGRVTDPSMMLGLMNLGDEVVSRSDTAKDAQPESSGAHSRLTGSVVEVAQAAPDRQPMYTVRWRDATQTKEQFEALAVHKQRDPPFERFSSCKHNSSSPPLTKCQQVVLSDVRTALLLFEDRLPWTCVTRAFAASRAVWRKELSHCASLRQFVRSYTDFLQYLKIEQHLPATRLQCNSPGTLNALHRCVDQQDYVGAQQIWLEQVMPDFEMWQAAAHGKQKPSHIHTGRVVHILESSHTAYRPASLAEVPWGALMSQEQLATLKSNLQREVEFCERKCEDLRALVARDAPLTADAMAGVTYDARGLGGTYGGMPRARPSMLDGVWNYRSDVDTEDDTGSEATDLADSLFEPPAADGGDDGAVSSGRADAGPEQKRARPLDAPESGRVSAESRDGSSSCMEAS